MNAIQLAPNSTALKRLSILLLLLTSLSEVRIFSQEGNCSKCNHVSGPGTGSAAGYTCNGIPQCALSTDSLQCAWCNYTVLIVCSKPGFANKFSNRQECIGLEPCGPILTCPDMNDPNHCLSCET